MSATELLLLNACEHVEPQLIPAGLLVTVLVEAPEPDFVTFRITGGFSVKVAVTVWAALIVTVQAPVPLHAPDQPAKNDPRLGVGVSFSEAGLRNVAEQVAPQLRPLEEPFTVPDPVPAFVTVSL